MSYVESSICCPNKSSETLQMREVQKSSLQPVTRSLLLYSSVVAVHHLWDILQPCQELKKSRWEIRCATKPTYPTFCCLLLMIELSKITFTAVTWKQWFWCLCCWHNLKPLLQPSSSEYGSLLERLCMSRHFAPPLTSTVRPVRYKWTELKHFIILFFLQYFCGVTFQKKRKMYVFIRSHKAMLLGGGEKNFKSQIPNKSNGLLWSASF